MNNYGRVFNMFYVKVLIFCIIFITILFFIGNYVIYLLKLEKRISKIFVVGFITLLSIFQLIAYPLALIRGSFIVLVTIYSIIIIILMILSLLYFAKERFAFIEMYKKSMFLFMIIILIAGQAYMSSYMHHTDDDDAYFITVSTTTQESGIISSETQFASTGIKSNDIDKRPNTSTWEYFIALLSYVSSIEVVILAHTILPLLLIPLSYLAVYQVSEYLIEDKKRKYFMLFYTLLNIFGGYIVYTPACFLLLRIWQGKAVLVSIIFPILLSNCLELMQINREKKQYWVYNALILLAGVSTSVIGVYLTPLYYMIIGVPYLFTIGWKKAKKIVVLIIFSLLPCAIFTILSFVQVLTENKEYMSRTAPDWMNLFKTNILTGYYYVFLIIALIYIIFKGNRIQKIFLLGSTVFTFFTFLNPLFCTFVAQKITGVDVYWRLYWTLPVFFSIAFLLSDILYQIKKKLYKLLVFACMILTLHFAGYYIYQQPFYSPHQNMYKLPNEVIDIVDFIINNQQTSEKPNVLYPEDLSAKVRQYKAEVVTVWSRELYQKNKIIPNTNISLSSFYHELYDGKIKDIDYLIKNLENLEIEWIVMPEDIKLIKASNIILLQTIDGYNIYKFIREY
jgi:hypothetical protein